MFNPNIPDNNLPLLPPKDLHLSEKTYWQLSKASRALATLNTYITTNTENVGFLVLGSFLLQEGVASSAIENINTTLESVFQAEISSGKISKEDKEVLSYKEATLRGIQQVEKYGAIISNTLVTIQSMIEPEKAGLRKIPGTVLMNSSREVIYTPPIGETVIRDLLSNLETYINSDDNIDPLVKLAIIHYQFESIHPFPDGNGRTGRILMILYLILKGLLKLPVLYISEYINIHKSQYYKVLHSIREEGDWDSLVYYILQAVEEQSKITTEKLEKITKLIHSTVEQVEENGLKIPYGFIQLFFDNPYNTITGIEKTGKYAKRTIQKYCKQLEICGVLNRRNDNKEKPYYIRNYLKILVSQQNIKVLLKNKNQ